MLNTAPLMTKEAARGIESRFADTTYVTVPVAMPLAPDCTVIHELVLITLHAQPVPASTLKLLPEFVPLP